MELVNSGETTFYKVDGAFYARLEFPDLKAWFSVDETQTILTLITVKEIRDKLERNFMDMEAA